MKLKPENMLKEINETKSLFFKRSQIDKPLAKKELDRSYLYRGEKRPSLELLKH